MVSFHTQIYESILDENEAKAYEAMKTHLSRVETLITMRNEDKSQRTEAKQRKGSSEEEEEI